jgi:hypothetical protein
MMSFVQQIRNIDECFGRVTTIIEAGAADLITLYEGDSLSVPCSGCSGGATGSPCTDDEQIVCVVWHVFLPNLL